MRKMIRLVISVCLASFASAPLFAQYGGGMGGTVGAGGTTGSGGATTSATYGSSRYGNGKAIGIGVGAAAAGAAGLYLLMHHGSSVTGCVLSADDGLRLADDSGKRSFSVMPNGAALVPGEHIRLRGKIIKEQDGTEVFEAKKLVKNLGTCGPQSAALHDSK